MQLSFVADTRAPVHVHLLAVFLALSMWPLLAVARCCFQTAKQAAKLCVLCFWPVGGAAGVHLSASSAGLAVAIETKHRVCFGVRQTCSLGPSHTHSRSLLFGGFYRLVTSVAQGGRWLSLQEIRPALRHARHLLERSCTLSNGHKHLCLLFTTSPFCSRRFYKRRFFLTSVPFILKGFRLKYFKFPHVFLAFLSFNDPHFSPICVLMSQRSFSFL